MRDARLTLDWADGTYTFRLAWGELAELQEQCNAGPYVILDRLYTRQWRIEDVSNVIRLGLIGGGMEPVKALKLVRSYVEARPPMENVLFATGILSAGLMGAPDEPAGEGEAPNQIEKSSTTFPTESSDLAQSTD
jgi:hypothetical protein